MIMLDYRKLLIALLFLLVLGGCGASNDSSDSSPSSSLNGTPGPGNSGVTQSGAQDFGLFRQILEDGEIPAPSTLDDLGFFAEHKLDYPAPDCGSNICMHTLLGINSNMVNGADCTTLQLGMNSPLNASELPRPPLNLVIAVDVSGSMQGTAISYVRSGLIRMLSALQPEDHVSLVTFSSQAGVVVDDVPATEKETLQTAFSDIKAGGNTNIYDGLYQALSLAASHSDPAKQNRVLFLSDGVATQGLTNAAKAKSLAAGYAKQGIAITTVGVGTNFDADLMRSLGEVGGGNFYFLEDPVAVEEVFTEEVETAFFPLALDVEIKVKVAEGYVTRGTYGTKGYTGGTTGGSIHIPALYLAARKSAHEPIAGGRRGGGGAILFEMVPASTTLKSQANVGNVEFTYVDPQSGEKKTQTFNAQVPSNEEVLGYYSSFTSEKAFVMLNLFAGFQMATQAAYDADINAALTVLRAMEPNVSAWVNKTKDPDIQDDLKYLRLFIANLEKLPNPLQTPVTTSPGNPWPYGD
jgi:Ca-activated chloride channel homolog